MSGDANRTATTSISKDTAISGKLELLVNESRVVTANVVTLTTAAYDEKLPVAPKGAIEPRLCADLPAMCGSEPVVSDIGSGCELPVATVTIRRISQTTSLLAFSILRSCACF